MIGEVLSEKRNRRSSDDVPNRSRKKDKGEVGLILACDLAEVDDDGSDCGDCASVNSEHQRVGGEVDVF